MEIPKPAKPEPNRFEASKNPKSEYRSRGSRDRNKLKIQMFKNSKQTKNI